ncbi:MAG: TatD family deoxyribonuclease, partial [Candidatus Eisenbacteria bacterium]
MIDTHCHLCDRRFDRDRQSCRTTLAIAERHEGVFAALGIHPHQAGGNDAERVPELSTLLGHDRAVAVGETGLDFFRDYAPRADQERWFRAQLALADEVGLPVVIHQRAALADTLAILEKMRPAAGGVLHCFDDGPEAAARAQALGFKLGLGGVLTYGHAPLEEVARTAPEGML